MRLYVSDETGGNVVVVDPEAGTVVERIAVGKTAARHPAVPRRQAAAGCAVGFADCRPWRRRVQAAAARSRRRRHRRGRSRHAQAGAHPPQRPGSRVLRHLAGWHEGLRVERRRRGDVGARSRIGDRHRARHGRRGAGGGHAAAGRQGCLRRLRSDQRSGGGRYRRPTRSWGGSRPARGHAASPSRPTPGSRSSATRTTPTSRSSMRRRTRSSQTIKIPPTAGTPTVPRPMGAAITGDGKHLFFSLGRAKSIAVLDAVERKFLRSIEDVGTRVVGHRAQRRRPQALHGERRLRRRLGRRRRDRQGREAHHHRAAVPGASWSRSHPSSSWNRLMSLLLARSLWPLRPSRTPALSGTVRDSSGRVVPAPWSSPGSYPAASSRP